MLRLDYESIFGQLVVQLQKCSSQIGQAVGVQRFPIIKGVQRHQSRRDPFTAGGKFQHAQFDFGICLRFGKMPQIRNQFLDCRIDGTDFLPSMLPEVSIRKKIGMTLFGMLSAFPRKLLRFSDIV